MRIMPAVGHQSRPHTALLEIIAAGPPPIKDQPAASMGLGIDGQRPELDVSRCSACPMSGKSVRI